ncbi:MAG: hypothetical protein KC478_00545 [Bacteriovoracaceae bacterium]|nr:hypothetical protein [Bacteriovoracaceae bacterium]
MAKVMISFFALSVLMVTTAVQLLDSAFTPKNLTFSPREFTQSYSVVELPQNIKLDVAALELEEADFIPTIDTDHNNESEEVMVDYVAVKKNININVQPTASVALEVKTLSSVNKLETINGEEPVKLYGFKKVTKIETMNLAANFAPINIGEVTTQLLANTDNKEQQSNTSNDKSFPSSLDRISTAMAATEKSNQQTEEIKNISGTVKESEEDLVFFDYSKNNEASTSGKKNLTTVEKIATTHTGKAPSKNAIINEIVKGMGKGFKNENGVSVASSSKQQIGNKEVPVNPHAEMAFAKKVNNQKYTSVYRLNGHGHSLVSKKFEDVSNFELRFADDRDDILRSESNGTVVLEENLSSDYAVRRATVFSSGYLPTSMDLVLEEQEVNLTVPLISTDSFSEVLKKNQLRGLGAQVLIELDELTEDADFDVSTKYEKKLFLDRTLRVVDRGDSAYSYIMFVGVETGNKILSFKTYKNQVTSKIIHLVEDELYFDFNFYHHVKKDSFELFEEHLLAKESGLLSVDEDQVIDLAFESEINKKTVNRLEIKEALYSVGARKYYELKHQRDSIFVGRWNSDFIDVPSEAYKQFALSSFDVFSMRNHCMVQVNIQKQAKELSYNGSSFRGGMGVQARILDTDGVFYNDLSDQSKRIFLLGEEQGTINIKIKYVDNSVDYLQSFCSQSNYLVEQL